MTDLASDAMEDLAIEELIADVVANPTPVRVACAPTSVVALPAAGPGHRTVARAARGVFRRARVLVRRWLSNHRG